MEAMTREASLDWGQAAESSRTRFLPKVKVGPFLLGGREPIHDLRLIDVSRAGVYLTFPLGVALARDEVYRVVRPVRRREDRACVSGRPRKIVAEVEITKVMEDTRALVRVLTGSVIRGTGAEKKRGGPAR